MVLAVLTKLSCRGASADVVVIGAGIIGCAAAYFLAADDHRVTVIEHDDCGIETAFASGGWVIILENDAPAEVVLVLDSRRLYKVLHAEGGIALLTDRGMTSIVKFG